MRDTPYPIRSVVSPDGAAILDVGRGTITTLNKTGAYVWQRLERGESPASIAVALALETGQNVIEIEQDVRRFVETLQRSQLVRDELGGRHDEPGLPS